MSLLLKGHNGIKMYFAIIRLRVCYLLYWKEFVRGYVGVDTLKWI